MDVFPRMLVIGLHENLVSLEDLRSNVTREREEIMRNSTYDNF